MASKISGLVEKISIDSTQHSIASTAYGYCETAAATTPKVVEMTGFQLLEGVTIYVKFKERNNVANPKLKIKYGSGDNDVTAEIPIVQYATAAVGTGDSTTGWYAGAVVSLTYDGTSWVKNQGFNSDSDSTGYYHRRIYPNLKAGTGGIDKYVIIMQLPNGRWSGIVPSSQTTASNGTVSPKATGKTASTNQFMLGHVLLMYANATYADGANVGTYNIWSAYSGLIDARYSFNLENTEGNRFIGYTPVYIVGTVSNGLFTLDSTKWWAQALPSSEDGKVYIYIGDAYDWYRLAFVEDKPIYYYKDGAVRLYTDDIYVKKSGDTMTGNLTLLNSATGATPGVIFQRKDLGDAYTDWKIFNTASGNLVIGSRISNEADFQNKFTYTYTGDLTATSFTGNGSALTNLNASNIGSGTLNLARLGNQNKNLVLAGPASGNAATPSFRALVAADIPDIGGTYLKLTGGTMTGGINLVGNQSSAYNDKGLIFTQGSRIGENNAGGLGIYAAERIYLRPDSPTSSSSDGIEISGNGVIPSNNNTETLGDSSHKWSKVYATNLNGNLYVTAHTNTTDGHKNYYPWFSTATSGNLGARAHAGVYIYETVASGAISSLDFCMGSTSITGSITLWDGSSHWGNIKPGNLSANRNYTLPNQAGTFALLTRIDANALINLLETGASDLTSNDYVITQYVGGGTTTTTYHRRPASKVINATLVKAALGTVSTTAKKFLKDTGAWMQVDWGDLTGKPSTFTPATHTHSHLVSLATITSGDSENNTHAAALKKYFDENKSTIPRNSLVNFYSNAYGNGSQAFGYWISGYNDAPYGGFFVAHYNTPRYVGISSGTYTQVDLITSGTIGSQSVHYATSAGTAGAFSSGTTVKLTGDTTGESSSSTKGWSVSTTTKYLSGTAEAGPALTTAPGTGKIRYSYNVNTGTTGLFDTNNNANSIITINRHSGNYDSQLGFSANGNIYYRSFNGTALNATTAWKQLAFIDSTVARANAVAWANVESKPDTATRWPAWGEVTGKPTSFTPAAHTHHSDNTLMHGYTRSQIGVSPNYDDPQYDSKKINGIYEIRSSSEVSGETGTKPVNGFYPMLSLQTDNVMMQFGGINSQGWFVRGKQAANVTLADVAWQKLITDANYKSYAWARPSTITANQVLVSSGTDGETALRGIRNNTSAGELGWTSQATDKTLVTTNTIAYWNGAYAGTNSNLTILGAVTTGTWKASVIGAAYIDSAIARLASPTFTGTPKSVTPGTSSDAKMIATKEYVDGIIAANDALVYKGTKAGTSSSTNGGTLMPAGVQGDTYKVSTAGYINGKYCEVGDMIICVTDVAASTTSNYTTTIANWNIIQTSDGTVSTSETSVTEGQIPTFKGTTGKFIQNSSKSFSTATPTSSSTDAQIPTAKAVWAAIDALDVSNISGFGVKKTLASLSETNGKISATFQDISVSHLQAIGDNRSTATTPNDYNMTYGKLIFQGLKGRATINNPSSDIYSYVIGLRGWSDSSGGDAHELAFNNSGINWRHGATTTWGSWERLATSSEVTASRVEIIRLA